MKETIYRYRIIRHDELPEERKQALRDRGIDPDDRWSLIYSFKHEADANEELERCIAEASPWETYKLKDAGETTQIERSDLF